MRFLENARFGASTIPCKLGSARIFGPTGLPVAPPAVRVLGRFPKLLYLRNEHLCEYLDIIRCREVPHLLVIVSEHYDTSLADLIRTNLSEANVFKASQQVIYAVDFLHTRGIVSGTLCLENILINSSTADNFSVRLTQYGIGYITRNGLDHNGPITSSVMVSPQQFISDASSYLLTQKDDIWAYGLVLLELIMRIRLSELWPFQQYATILQSLLDKTKSGSIFDALGMIVKNRLDIKTPSTKYSKIMSTISCLCLEILPSKRSTAQCILELLQNLCKNAHLQAFCPKIAYEEWENNNVACLSLDEWVNRLELCEAYFLWNLCGRRIEKILIAHDVIHTPHPVSSLPQYRARDGELPTKQEERSYQVTRSKNIFILPMSNFRAKLKSIDGMALLHSFELDGPYKHCEDSDLPVVVKEKNFTYQRINMKYVKQLLECYSIKKDELRHFVEKDIPPLFRGAVWAAFLNVHKQKIFNQLDTLSPHVSDRQLEVDIPRCHQYEELMTSPTAHGHLKRILKAWQEAHPRYVYWQGIDSVAAPFMLLNFEDPSTAFSCLSAFINKYLKDFFLKDNSKIIQEYLTLFFHLIAFADPELYNTMREIDFFPDLFAIPWFLTCFAHVLPLHKLFHLWDCLILKEPWFPLCVGLSILRQLRRSLIGCTFNDAILLFSDLPDLDMDSVVKDAKYFYELIPTSCAYRVHGSDNTDEMRSKMTSMDTATLKAFPCVRLSYSDLIEKLNTQAIVLIDVRPVPEFNRYSVELSINFPMPEEDSLLRIQNVLNKAQENKHPICIMDRGDMQRAGKFAARLISENVKHVCVLDGGFEHMKRFQNLLRPV